MSRKVKLEIELADGCENIPDERIQFGVYQSLGGKSRVKAISVSGEKPKSPVAASAEASAEG